MGKSSVGPFIYAMMPFIKLHEKIKFGKYVTNTTIDGFESSNAYIMIVHSTDDTTIPISYGYDLYYSRYKDNNRFPFIR